LINIEKNFTIDISHRIVVECKGVKQAENQRRLKASDQTNNGKVLVA